VEGIYCYSMTAAIVWWETDWFGLIYRRF